MAAADGAPNSISVTVRVRPFTIREAAQLTKCDDGPLFLGDGSLAAVPAPKLSQKGIRSVIKVVDDHCLVFDPPEDNPVQRFSRSVMPQGKRVKDQTFAFDKVFDENTTQGDVYESTTRSLLGSVLDGYNATVFAYGATGCGKTHTITGTAQQPGIIFLTMQELFERIGDMQGDKVTEISLSYLEIYNETIRDLLEPGGGKAGLMLREDANQAVSVAGLSSHHPQNVQEVMDMIVRGNELRTMSPTEANATSSRSHAVLQINVSQKDRNADVNEPHTMATLSIIDLAGSERASATKNRGERLLEGANINKSLLALGSCINALCDPRKRNHVPYRNSKLTRLLKFSLGGNCRTVMIVCVSPSSAHFDETQNTLRYANRAKNIQTKVTRNIYNVNRHVKDFLKKIDEQMVMINELKEQQKDYETLAFGKFRKQTERREAIVKAGVARLREAYDNSDAERKDRIGAALKLRQIERRISLIRAWNTALEHACEKNDLEEPSPTLSAIRKSAAGTVAELEESRHHCHQKLTKNNWQRAIDTALQTGLKQLHEVDGMANSSEASALSREAELLRSNFEMELYRRISEEDKGGDVALVQIQIQQLLESVNVLTQIMSVDEQDAMQTAKTVLPGLIKSCMETTSRVMRQDGNMHLIESFPPMRNGTPKRRKRISLMGPSPPKPRLTPAVIAQINPSPVRSNSPFSRRFKLGSAKKLGSPRKRTPKKKGVQWADNTNDGKLEDFSKTPQQHESTPEMLETSAPTISSIAEEVSESDGYSSPIPAPPQTSLDVKPRLDRFQTGFLTRKQHDSPAPPTLTYIASSPEASPLQEISNNLTHGRLSADGSKNRNLATVASSHEKSSDSEEQGWITDREDIKDINKFVKRASASRSASIRESIAARGGGASRRHSPSTLSATAGAVTTASSDQATTTTIPENNNPLFTASHARRMVRSEKDVDAKASSVLSPRTAPVLKATSHAGVRKTAGGGGGGEERIAAALMQQQQQQQQRSNGRVVSGGAGRLSILPSTGPAASVVGGATAGAGAATTGTGSGTSVGVSMGSSGAQGRGSMSSGAKVAWKWG